MAQVRTFVVMGLLAALLAVFAFVALGERGSEVTDEPPRYVEPREEEPVSQVGQGGTARLALPISARPECLNPYVPGCEGAEALNGLVFEGLLTLSPESEYRPSLAEGMPSYGDGTLSLEPMTIELRVRENAAFSDGEPVTSADVKWTYGRAAELAGDGGVSALYSGFSNLEEVETEGRKTVRLVFAEPYAEWRTLLTAPVLPEHVYGKEDLASLALMEEPVGSGPFVFDEELEAGFAFAASARHWREALEFPRLDGLIVEFTGPSESAGGL
ncbi:MAG: ABC transporter substrate-binding protein, partial [Rubrobacteraceae bacterium]